MSAYHAIWFLVDVHRLLTGHASPWTLFYLAMGVWGLWRSVRWMVYRKREWRR